MDNLARIERLEEQVGDLREDRARDSEAQEHLTGAVEALTAKVAELNDTINRGRGALWIIGGVGATAGALGAAILDRLFGA